MKKIAGLFFASASVLSCAFTAFSQDLVRQEQIVFRDGSAVTCPEGIIVQIENRIVKIENGALTFRDVYYWCISPHILIPSREWEKDSVDYKNLEPSLKRLVDTVIQNGGQSTNLRIHYY